MTSIEQDSTNVEPKEDALDRYLREELAKYPAAEKPAKEQVQAIVSNQTEHVQDEIIATGKRHSISRPLARRYGPKGAAVLRFLAYHIRRSKNVREGKKWYYNPIDEIASSFPYIPRSTMGDILDALEKKGAIQTGCFNRWHKDKTLWYTMDLALMDEAEKDIIWFDANEAEEYGLCGAILLHNLRWHLREENDKKKEFQPMIPSVLAELWPFSVATIERVLAEFKKGHLIVQKEARSSQYKLGTSVVIDPSISDLLPSESDLHPSISDKVPSKSVDNTHYKPLEIPLVNTQASPAQVCELVPEQLDQSKSISGEAEDTNAYGYVDDKCSVAVLKQKNSNKADRFKEECGKAIADRLIAVCDKFTHSLSAQQIIDIKSGDNPDEMLQRSKKVFEPFFFAICKGGTQKSQQALFEVALEFIHESFQSLKTQRYGHSIPLFQRYIYNVMLPMVRTLEANRMVLRETQLQECKKDYASVDQAKEPDANLAPAEKTRIFSKALASMNKVGWPGKGAAWPVNQIIYNNGSLDKAEEFFALNPDVSAAELLGIINKCVLAKLYEVSEQGKMDPLWHVKKGVDLRLFFKYLEKITSQLSISNTFKMLPKVEEKRPEYHNMIELKAA